MQMCIEEGLLKDAWKLVREWNLHDTFPDVELTYLHRTLHKMTIRGAWGPASSLVVDHPVLQASASDNFATFCCS